MKNECWEGTIGNNCKVCYKDEKDNTSWIFGKVENMNSHSIFIHNNEAGLLIIPYDAIMWMLPNGLSKQKKQKIEQANLDTIMDCAATIKSITGKKPTIVASKAVIEALNNVDEKWDA